MSSRQISDTNPKLEIKLKISRKVPLSLEVAYINGTTYVAGDSDIRHTQNLISAIFFHAYCAEIDYVESQKPMP